MQISFSTVHFAGGSCVEKIHAGRKPAVELEFDLVLRARFHIGQAGSGRGRRHAASEFDAARGLYHHSEAHIACAAFKADVVPVQIRVAADNIVHALAIERIDGRLVDEGAV
ncbi:hypothetical protein D3C71_811680 [compost metagenome]